MNYEQPEAGGVYEHRSGDCPQHGLNVPFARPYRTCELFRCVRCLELARLLEWMPGHDEYIFE